MKRNLTLPIVIVVLLVIGAGIYFLLPKYQPSQTNNLATGNNIDISNFAFVPSDLVVKVGDIVTWTNKDIAPHIIVSDTGNELTSEKLNQGNSYSHIFTTAGTYNYHCSIHPSMKGQIIVG
ncbi:MAG: cupredoxin family copper-binding protein [Nanoarchaeota archaeon]